MNVTVAHNGKMSKIAAIIPIGGSVDTNKRSKTFIACTTTPGRLLCRIWGKSKRCRILVSEHGASGSKVGRVYWRPASYLRNKFFRVS
jgi:hypothetical protein